jgi:hypothetical protein
LMDQDDLYSDDTQISPPVPFRRDVRKHSWELCQGRVFVRHRSYFIWPRILERTDDGEWRLSPGLGT